MLGFIKGQWKQMCVSRGRGGGGDGMPEYIVVTILVAAQGKLDLPKVTNQESLVKALNKLAAVREDQVSKSTATTRCL